MSGNQIAGCKIGKEPVGLVSKQYLQTSAHKQGRPSTPDPAQKDKIVRAPKTITSPPYKSGKI